MSSGLYYAAYYAAILCRGLPFTRSAANVHGTSSTPQFGLSYALSETFSLWELQTFTVLMVDSDSKPEGFSGDVQISLTLNLTVAELCIA